MSNININYAQNEQHFFFIIKWTNFDKLSVYTYIKSPDLSFAPIQSSIGAVYHTQNR